MRSFAAVAAIYFFTPSLCLASQKSRELPADRKLLDSFMSEPSFNGLSPGEAGKFWEKWTLVTTRYRKDNGQIRFIYANDLAEQALKRMDGKFPEGAIFAKIAFSSASDPNFPASQIPGAVVRIQLMKKSTEKYKATGGWAYGLFTGEKNLNAAEEARACFACHAVVKDRDYIFSDSAFLPFARPAGGTSFQAKFVLKPWESLSPEVKRRIEFTGSSPRQVKVSEMDMFAGSFGESIAAMAEFSQKDGVPYLLTDGRKRVLYVHPVKPRGECKSMASFTSTWHVNGRRRAKGWVCDGKLHFGGGGRWK